MPAATAQRSRNSQFVQIVMIPLDRKAARRRHSCRVSPSFLYPPNPIMQSIFLALPVSLDCNHCPRLRRYLGRRARLMHLENARRKAGVPDAGRPDRLSCGAIRPVALGACAADLASLPELVSLAQDQPILCVTASSRGEPLPRQALAWLYNLSARLLLHVPIRECRASATLPLFQRSVLAEILP